MKEATQTPYNRCIFRETFSDEQSVRRNGGIPTDVTISNGIGSFNGISSGIVYPKNFNGTYSIRIRFKEPKTFSSNQYLCDFRRGTGVGYIYCTETTILASSGTGYANGVASTSSIAVKELVVSGMPITSTELTMGRRTPPYTSYFNGDFELFEIYQGTLTASEVANLYNNTWNKELSGYGGQIGVESITNTDFTDADWTESGTISNVTTNSFTSSSNGGMKIIDAGLVVGKRYRIIFTGTTTAKNCQLYNNNMGTLDNLITGSFISSKDFTAVATGLYVRNDGAGNTTITELSAKELQPDLLLDFDSTSGVIKDRTSKNTLTATDVSIKKTGSFYGAEFNGTTSTLITDSTDPTIWQSGFTLMAWINLRSYGGANYGRIFDKSINTASDAGFYFSVESSGNRFIYQLSGGSLLISNNNIFVFNKWYFVVLTVSSDSKINFYIGDLNTAPALGGLANQTGGLISGITTTNPLTIGNRSTALDRSFDGKIKMAKAYSGVLSLEDLTQIWSSTRGKIE